VDTDLPKRNGAPSNVPLVKFGSHRTPVHNKTKLAGGRARDDVKEQIYVVFCVYLGLTGRKSGATVALGRINSPLVPFLPTPEFTKSKSRVESLWPWVSTGPPKNNSTPKLVEVLGRLRYNTFVLRYGDKLESAGQSLAPFYLDSNK